MTEDYSNLPMAGVIPPGTHLHVWGIAGPDEIDTAKRRLSSLRVYGLNIDADLAFSEGGQRIDYGRARDMPAPLPFLLMESRLNMAWIARHAGDALGECYLTHAEMRARYRARFDPETSHCDRIFDYRPGAADSNRLVPALLHLSLRLGVIHAASCHELLAQIGKDPILRKAHSAKRWQDVVEIPGMPKARSGFAYRPVLSSRSCAPGKNTVA